MRLIGDSFFLGTASLALFFSAKYFLHGDFKTKSHFNRYATECQFFKEVFSFQKFFFPLILIFEKKNYLFLKHNEVRKNSNEMKYISMWVYIKLNSLLAVLAWHQKWRFAYEIWHLSNGCYVCFLNINWLKTNFKTIVIFFRPQCAFIIFLTIYFTFIIKTN